MVREGHTAGTSATRRSTAPMPLSIRTRRRHVSELGSGALGDRDELLLATGVTVDEQDHCLPTHGLHSGNGPDTVLDAKRASVAHPGHRFSGDSLQGG